jgi:hypothetical protein
MELVQCTGLIGYLEGRRRAFFVRGLGVYSDDCDVGVGVAQAGCGERVDVAREIDGCMSRLFG